MHYICTIKLIKNIDMSSITMTDQKEFKFAKGSTTTLNEFEELFEELFNRTWIVFGEEYHLPSLGWKKGYNKRKRSLGLCSYRAKRATRFESAKLIKPGAVWISMELLSRNLDKAYDFEDTIRHEIAHAIHCHISGRSSHDRIWKAICREIGADDNRCHEGFLENPKGKYTLTCPTPECEVVIEKYRKPKHTKACGKCCKKYSNGRFDPKFKFIMVQNY